MIVKLKAPYARFTHPLFKSEGLTYPIPTPTSLIGILEAIYWKPQMQYKIHRIKIMNPIAEIPFSENGIIFTAGMDQIAIDERIGKDMVRTQRRGSMLKDVCYLVDFCINADDDRKHYSILYKRLRNGSCFKHPYMGIRECGLSYFGEADWDESPSVQINKDFGFILLTMGFSPVKKGSVMSRDRQSKRWVSVETNPVFFRAKAIDNVVTVPEVKHDL